MPHRHRPAVPTLDIPRDPAALSGAASDALARLFATLEQGGAAEEALRRYRIESEIEDERVLRAAEEAQERASLAAALTHPPRARYPRIKEADYARYPLAAIA